MARTATSSNSSSRNNSSGIGGVFPAMIEPARAEVIFNDLPQLLSFPLMKAKATAQNQPDFLTFANANSMTEFNEAKVEDDIDIPGRALSEYSERINRMNSGMRNYRSMVNEVLVKSPNNNWHDNFAKTGYLEGLMEYRVNVDEDKEKAKELTAIWSPFRKLLSKDPDFGQTVAKNSIGLPVYVDENGNGETVQNFYDVQYDNFSFGMEAKDLQTFKMDDWSKLQSTVESAFNGLNQDNIDVEITALYSEDKMPVISANPNYVENENEVSKITYSTDPNDGTWLQNEAMPNITDNQKQIYGAVSQALTNIYNDPELYKMFNSLRYDFMKTSFDSGKYYTVDEQGQPNKQDIPKSLLVEDDNGKPLFDVKSVMLGKADKEAVLKRILAKNPKDQATKVEDDFNNTINNINQSFQEDFFRGIKAKKYKLNYKFHKTYESNLDYENTPNLAKAKTEKFAKWLFNLDILEESEQYPELSEWGTYSTAPNSYPDIKGLETLAISLNLVPHDGMPTDVYNKEAEALGNLQRTDVENFNNYKAGIISPDDYKGSYAEAAHNQSLNYIGLASSNEVVETPEGELIPNFNYIMTADKPSVYGKLVKNIYKSQIITDKLKDVEFEDIYENANENFDAYKFLFEDEGTLNPQAGEQKDYIRYDPATGRISVLKDKHLYALTKKQYQDFVTGMQTKTSLNSTFPIFEITDKEVRAQFSEAFNEYAPSATYNFGSTPINLSRMTSILTFGDTKQVKKIKFGEVVKVSPAYPVVQEGGKVEYLPVLWQEVVIGAEDKNFTIPIADKDGNEVPTLLKDLTEDQKIKYGIQDNGEVTGSADSKDLTSKTYTLTVMRTMNGINSYFYNQDMTMNKVFDSYVENRDDTKNKVQFD